MRNSHAYFFYPRNTPIHAEQLLSNEPANHADE